MNLYNSLKIDKTTEVYILLDNYQEFLNAYNHMDDYLNEIK